MGEKQCHLPKTTPANPVILDYSDGSLQRSSNSSNQGLNGEQSRAAFTALFFSGKSLHFAAGDEFLISQSSTHRESPNRLVEARS